MRSTSRGSVTMTLPVLPDGSAVGAGVKTSVVAPPRPGGPPAGRREPSILRSSIYPAGGRTRDPLPGTPAGSAGLIPRPGGGYGTNREVFALGRGALPRSAGEPSGRPPVVTPGSRALAPRPPR